VLTAENTSVQQEPTSAAPTGLAASPPGSGTVVAGGVGRWGAPGGVVGGIPGGTGTAPAPSRARSPTLVDPDACQDYFPEDAEQDRGIVEVFADVSAGGRATSVSVLREQPPGNGFGAAPRRCFLAIRFAPALDAEGKATPGRVRLKFRFSR
jgi:hypothetical protein